MTFSLFDWLTVLKGLSHSPDPCHSKASFRHRSSRFSRLDPVDATAIDHASKRCVDRQAGRQIDSVRQRHPSQVCTFAPLPDIAISCLSSKNSCYVSAKPLLPPPVDHSIALSSQSDSFHSHHHTCSSSPSSVLVCHHQRRRHLYSSPRYLTHLCCSPSRGRQTAHHLLDSSTAIAQFSSGRR